MVGSPFDKHGYGGNSIDVLKLGYEHYKKHILDINDVDIFCHSSSVEFAEEIEKLYKPKKSLFIKQPTFNIPQYVTGTSDRKNAHYHKWFSHKKVRELRLEYESETLVEYDFVYIGRYDIAWNTDVVFEKFNNEKIYLTNWNRLFHNNTEVKAAAWYKFLTQNKLPFIKNGKPPDGFTSKLVGYPHNDEGVMDSWFFSAPSYMDRLCDLYDCLDEYTKPGKKWMNEASTVVDSSGNISNHRLIPKHLESIGLLEKLETVFYHHDDFPLIRRMYFNSQR